ncbi:MAG: hypothetical protein PVI59_03790 [Anaerolineae bacterium]|jgi:glyoxylase-like metal-dependent hydrolase (beta-lactamase superfamily II)
MKIQNVAPNMYVSTFYPGINVSFVLTDAGPVAVDAPLLPEDAEAWRRQIIHVAGKPIRNVILTDHRLERALSAGRLNAPIVAGRRTFELLQELGDDARSDTLEIWAKDHPQAAIELEDQKIVLPEVTVDGRVLLHGRPEIVVESVNGAAPGSVWARLVEERVLIAGDTVVGDVHPVLDAASDTRAWLRTLAKVRRAYFTGDTIIPGRGSVCSKADTRAVSEYIQRARRRIRSIHASERDRSDIASLIMEFLALFPTDDVDQERIERRIQLGLEHVFEELRPEREEPEE